LQPEFSISDYSGRIWRPTRSPHIKLSQQSEGAKNYWHHCILVVAALSQL